MTLFTLAGCWLLTGLLRWAYDLYKSTGAFAPTYLTKRLKEGIVGPLVDLSTYLFILFSGSKETVKVRNLFMTTIYAGFILIFIALLLV